MERESVYWDSNAFLGYLKDEADKADACGRVLQAAENGRLVIVTSALTLAEVIHLKGSAKLPSEQRSKVDAFFKAEYISVRNVTRATSELATELVWDNGIHPKDAIHVATAVLYKVPKLHTYDEKLLGSNGLILRGHKLEISKPSVVHQADWVDEPPK
jgi:predicted nucleic acid-binding protein